MIKSFLLALVLALILPSTWFVQAAEPDANAAPSVAGHYYLSGAHEVGSELLLKDSGQFQWMMSYGAVDHAAQGTWKREGERLILTPTAAPEPVFRLFEENDYRWTKPVAPGRWVAVTGVPGVGPVADLEVQFQARSGKVATAISQPNGDAIVNMPDSEEWVRAGVRASGRDAPWQWFSIPPERASIRLVGFALTNIESIQPPPFASLTLRLTPKGLVIERDDALQGTYVRR